MTSINHSSYVSFRNIKKMFEFNWTFHFACMCQFKGSIHQNRTKTFSHLLLVLSSDWFYVSRFLLSPLLRLLLPPLYNEGECSFVGAGRVSSRNNILAPQDNPQTSLPTVFKWTVDPLFWSNSKTFCMARCHQTLVGKCLYIFLWCGWSNPLIHIVKKCICV